MARHKSEKRYLSEMVVEGTGPFPIDMLRYDRCVPATEGDASDIAMSLRFQSGDEKKRIKLVRFGANPIQIPGERRMEWGRWESFGWRVIEERS